MKQAWEQMDNEGAKAFAAFSVYLRMRSQRSLAAVAKEVGKSKRLIERWSSLHRWKERLEAHAAQLALTEREGTEAGARRKAAEWMTRRDEQREEEWRARTELLELARVTIARWKKDKKQQASLQGIARLLELATKLGRRATGMPTDKTEVPQKDDRASRVEFEAALKKVYGAEASESPSAAGSSENGKG
jgi:hypothetical protein